FAAARASSDVTARGAARMSTSTISLPRPFIFTKGWSASALIIGLLRSALIWPNGVKLPTYTPQNVDQPGAGPAGAGNPGMLNGAGWGLGAGCNKPGLPGRWTGEADVLPRQVVAGGFRRRGAHGGRRGAVPRPGPADAGAEPAGASAGHQAG